MNCRQIGSADGQWRLYAWRFYGLYMVGKELVSKGISIPAELTVDEAHILLWKWMRFRSKSFHYSLSSSVSNPIDCMTTNSNRQR